MITANQYLFSLFKEKVYKISIDAGFTCPNRDGTLGTKGCIFCSAKGSGDFAGDARKSITEQINEGKVYGERKGAKKFIAYFQAFTNTYADSQICLERYMEAANNPSIVALSIATRPDCLNDDILSALQNVNSIKPVFVELGLQTIHEKSIEYIRRGYSNSIFDKAVADLKRIGISHVIVHVILGLPFETKEMMLQTVNYVVKSGADGIKLQLLHVLKETDLEKDYIDGKFDCLTLDEYVDIVKSAVDIIQDNLVIHRLTGDGDKKLLVAPLWSADKKRVLNKLNEEVK